MANLYGWENRGDKVVQQPNTTSEPEKKKDSQDVLLGKFMLAAKIRAGGVGQISWDGLFDDGRKKLIAEGMSIAADLKALPDKEARAERAIKFYTDKLKK